MGKRVEYTTAPRKPRNAKIVWSLLVKKHKAPDRMHYDSARRLWIAYYGEKTEEFEYEG